jgi:glycosyltransferase involved in cell wall biosynthesis
VDHVSLFITPSAFLRTKLIEGGLPASKIFVRTNSVVAPTLHSAPPPRDGFQFAGRLVPSKGVQTMLDAWKSREDMPRLAIAGAGEMEPLVRAATSEGQIDYLGALASSDVFAAMSRAVALVVPSTWFETQGLTVIEAFSHGVPVIASNIGALPEAVRDGETGLLVSPGDAQELAEAVVWASRNAPAMAAMGEQGFSAFAERYAPEPSLNRLVELYESLADRRKTVEARREAASLR